MCKPDKTLLRKRRGHDKICYDSESDSLSPPPSDLSIASTSSSSSALTSASKSITAPTQTNKLGDGRWSSGVLFHPEGRYWRIGGQWYDFTNFKHPGGENILYLARDRFDDATYAFEAHHLNFKRARARILKYRLSAPLQKELNDSHRVPAPKLLPDSSFYSSVRVRVDKYLNEKGSSYGDSYGGPDHRCIRLFWTIFTLWILSLLNFLLLNTTIPSAVGHGIISAWLGAFGHNFVHQPKYRWMANLSLDTVGFSSEAWFREHVLQHHMYTNTPLDNHFKGTDPFLITDPTVERNWFQTWIVPYFNWVVLFFGVWGNYSFHTVELLQGHEVFKCWKLLFPTIVGLFVVNHGIRGFFLFALNVGTLGIYYFTIALMNHNAESCLNVNRRNAQNDWGAAQIVSCADWGVQCGFFSSMRYLWLNYHVVHHLFPLIDQTHHVDIQLIIMEECKRHGLQYEAGSFWNIYREMVSSFGTPLSLWKEINSYNGS